jgi:hypothetical protein
MPRNLAQIIALYDTAEVVPSAESERVPAGPLLLIVQLGATNDANGTVDRDVRCRAQVVVELHRHATAAGRSALVLTSGGVHPDFPFNPTTTPHWAYVQAALLDAGLDEQALLLPGLPALHTVEETLLCRELASRIASRTGCANLKLLIVTSDFHAPRVRHLFGVSFALVPTSSDSPPPAPPPSPTSPRSASFSCSLCYHCEGVVVPTPTPCS